MIAIPNETPETKSIRSEIKDTKPWIHQKIECGHYQEIPVAANAVECEGCTVIFGLFY